MRVQSILYLMLFGVLMVSSVEDASAKKIFYFLTGYAGSQDTGSPAPGSDGDGYFESVSKEHGKMKDDRHVEPIGVSFDFYRVVGKLASGFGFGINNYTKTYRFKDNSSTRVNVRALLFTLTTYYRGGTWFPYFEIGTGNYSVKFREILITETDEQIIKRTSSFIDATPHTYHYGIGMRIPIRRWGLLLGWRASRAQIKVQTNGHRLELGGNALIAGAYLGF